MTRDLRLGLFLASAFLSAGPLVAEDFTITIPYNFSRLPPSVAMFFAHCSVYSNDPSLGGVSMGEGTRSLNLPGLSPFKGNLVVSFNVRPGQDPALATRYECTGYFSGRDSNGVTVLFFTTKDGPEVRFPLQAGAPFSLATGIQPLPH